MKRNEKWKIPQTFSERWTLCFNSYKNCRLKIKLVSWSSWKKKNAFFVTFILSKGNFFRTFVLSQCIEYWINFQNIYTFKQHFIQFCCLIFRSLKDLSVSFSFIINTSKWPTCSYVFETKTLLCYSSWTLYQIFKKKGGAGLTGPQL